MKRYSIFLFCLWLIGCTSVARLKSVEVKNAERIRILETETKQLRDGITQKENELAALKESIQQNDQLIKEKDVKIEELRKKLEALGVFEKKE